MSDDSLETEDFESRWPKTGDRLFVESARLYDARVISDPAERFYRMPMGYKRAGDILIDQAAEDVVKRSNIIYAALFCYRQFVELSLKRLIEKFGRAKAHGSKNTHDLSRLWETFMLIAEDRGSKEAVGTETVQELVTEMHEADQKSDGFRFPAGTDGAPFLFRNREISLANLREVVQGLENFFECTYLEFTNQDELSSDAFL